MALSGQVFAWTGCVAGMATLKDLCDICCFFSPLRNDSLCEVESRGACHACRHSAFPCQYIKYTSFFFLTTGYYKKKTKKNKCYLLWGQRHYLISRISHERSYSSDAQRVLHPPAVKLIWDKSTITQPIWGGEGVNGGKWQTHKLSGRDSRMLLTSPSTPLVPLKSLEFSLKKKKKINPLSESMSSSHIKEKVQGHNIKSKCSIYKNRINLCSSSSHPLLKL